MFGVWDMVGLLQRERMDGTESQHGYFWEFCDRISAPLRSNDVVYVLVSGGGKVRGSVGGEKDTGKEIKGLGYLSSGIWNWWRSAYISSSTKVWVMIFGYVFVCYSCLWIHVILNFLEMFLKSVCGILNEFLNQTNNERCIWYVVVQTFNTRWHAGINGDLNLKLDSVIYCYEYCSKIPKWQ